MLLLCLCAALAPPAWASDPACDADADGSIALACGGDDCDDSDPQVRPGATERCDGLDNDCDGTFDGPSAADAVPLYLDADSDGWGVALTGALGCGDEPARSTRGGDCDDADPAINPGAIERCDPDAQDEDCDGLIDDLDPEVDPAGQQTVWIDADADGYGDARTRPVLLCDPDEVNGAAVGGDCDDAAPQTHPGAPELDDGQDNDCDGLTEDSDTDGDGVADLLEQSLGLDPSNPDSDGDGLEDGRELGGDPPLDTDGDGVIDALDPTDDSAPTTAATQPGKVTACAATGWGPHPMLWAAALLLPFRRRR